MKKLLIVGILVIIGFFFFQAEEEILIPNDAIRFRVIANSDSKEDQETKEFVSRKVQEQISMKLKDIENVEEARKALQKNVPVFHETVEEALAMSNVDMDFQIHYGMNHFPDKIYNGVTYKEGEYESLVITLGEGMGKNWWCVLFPPICLLEADESSSSSEVEYKFFLKELIDKYF